MFYHIAGQVTDLLPQMAVIDCGGVGYALNTTNHTIARLKIGERGKLYTYVMVREDSFDLYGFYSLSEKRCFEMLIGVSGVGPKAALSILSANTPEGLAMAVLGGDEKALTVAPGVGKKIAQRILLELKDKMAKEAGGENAFSGVALEQPAAAGGIRRGDASAALAVLGYSSGEIAAALRDVDTENLSVEEIVRSALKNMLH